MVVHLSKEIQKFVEEQAAKEGFQSTDEFVEEVLRREQKNYEAKNSQAESERWLKQKNAIERLQNEFEHYPQPNSCADFTERDHDRLIYEDD